MTELTRLNEVENADLREIPDVVWKQLEFAAQHRCFLSEAKKVEGATEEEFVGVSWNNDEATISVETRQIDADLEEWQMRYTFKLQIHQWRRKK
jgi:hypothetical protein